MNVAGIGCKDRKRCYEAVSRKNLGEDCLNITVRHQMQADGYRFSKGNEKSGLYRYRVTFKMFICQWDFPHFKIEGRGLGKCFDFGISTILYDKAGVPITCQGRNISG